VSARTRPSPRRAGRIGIFAGLCSLAMSAVLPSGSAIAGPQPEERPVYVTNADSSDISTFAVDVATGRPTLVGDRAKAGGGVRQMAFTPDARLAYASNSEADTISAYKVGQRGALTPLPEGAGTVDSGGETPLGTVVAPNGHTLYVAHVSEDDPNGGTIAIFTIASDGELKPLGSPTPATVPHPRGLAITPDGRFLYAGHGDPDPGRRDTSVGAITSYAVNGDGTLTPIGLPIRVARFCGDSAITPDGRRLYMVCQDTNEIYGFAIGSNGGLTPLPRSPYTVSEFPEGITTSPDGRFVFAASPGRTTDGAVSAFSVGADGGLTEVPGSPVPGGFGPVGIATLPNGRFVYSSTDFDSSEDNLGALDAYVIGTAGTLKPLLGSPFLTGGKGPAYGSFAVLPDQGPAAGFTAHLDGPSVTFDASASTDPDGHVVRYRWDFGDGTTQTTIEPQTTHFYSRSGRFRATLFVTDNEGCSTTIVSTGKAILCNGTTAAATSHIITVGG
jgi:6-phosphogluconolactonase (cycloisomerase 2 family)